MIRFLLGGAALVALAACQPAVPDSGAPVGFDRIDQERAARDAALEGQPVTTISGPAPVLTTPLDDNSTVPVTPLSQDELAAARARADNSGVDPLQASPANPAPTVNNALGISTENNFEAVSNERSIESDAQRIAQSRAQYQVVQPTALPTRSSTAPNIVAYALQTTHPRGTPVYRRSSLNAERKFTRACAQYGSADLAQIAFLEAGGPERDRQGMDPDGDGYACGWDPAPYRAVKSQVPGR